jgi:hypothetical protein
MTAYEQRFLSAACPLKLQKLAFADVHLPSFTHGEHPQIVPFDACFHSQNQKLRFLVLVLAVAEDADMDRFLRRHFVA